MIGEFDDSISNDRRRLLEDYHESSKDTMMNIVYKALIEGETQAINSKTPTDEKLNALNNVLTYKYKVNKTKQTKALRDNREYTKPSAAKRRQNQKAQYIQKKNDAEQG
jgi:ribosomal protein S21